MAHFPPDVIAAACASMNKWDIPASVCLAQWALESSYGEHMPLGSNNAFGIKARDGEPFVSSMTWEVLHGRNVRVVQKFRKFDSIDQAFDAHGSLLAKGSAYDKARAVRHDAKAFARALTGHYATDPNYGTKLITIMDANGLYRWDGTAAPTGALTHDVAWLQASLNTLGADPKLVVDGRMGDKTKAALYPWQTANHLKPDGVAGPLTVAAIERALSAVPIRALAVSSAQGSTPMSFDILSFFAKAVSVVQAVAPQIPHIIGDIEKAGPALQKAKDDIKKLDVSATIADVQDVFTHAGLDVAALVKGLEASKDITAGKPQA